MNTAFDAPAVKPFGELRGLLSKHEYSQEELADKIGCSRSHLSKAINGNTEWRLDYCYRILDIFRIPHSELNKYFPKDGGQA